MGCENRNDCEENDYDRQLRKLRERIEKVRERLANVPLSNFVAREFYFLEYIFGRSSPSVNNGLDENTVKGVESFADEVKNRIRANKGDAR